MPWRCPGAFQPSRRCPSQGGIARRGRRGAPKCSKVHGAESIFSRMISPTSNDCAEHRRLHQAGASVARHAAAMACSGARRLLGYAFDTWD